MLNYDEGNNCSWKVGYYLDMKLKPTIISSLFFKNMFFCYVIKDFMFNNLNSFYPF